MLNKSGENKVKSLAIKAGVIAIWLLLWQLSAKIVGSPFLFPEPVAVFEKFVRLAVTKEFWLDCLLSLGRISAGCALGVMLGTLLGVITAFSKVLYEFFSPLLTVIKTTPVASFIILLLIWVKRDGVPVVISFLMVVPIMWANVSSALKKADKSLLEAAKIFRFTKRQKARAIYIPAAVPAFVSGCTTAIGFSWKAGIAAEVLSTPSAAIGSNLYRAKLNLEYTDLFAWTIAVIILSFIIEKAVIAFLKSVGTKYSFNLR